MTPLDALTEGLEQRVNDSLGSEITYLPVSGTPLTFNAWVVFDTTLINPSNSAGSIDVVQIEVPVAKVPMPVRDDRFTIAKRPGKIFALAERNEGPSGETWILPLKRVSA